MQMLLNIWSEMGLQEDQQEERTQSVIFELRNLLKELVCEEEEKKATIQANVETCSEEVYKLTQELGLPTYEPEKPMNILALENDLYTKVDKLQREKHERMKNLKSLRDTESMFCEQLCLPAHNMGYFNVPTKEQLEELEANVEYLRKEQVKRLNTFKELRQSIQILWRDLEIVPSTTIGQQLAHDDAETTFPLSCHNIEVLRDLNLELVNEQKKCITESSELRDTIKLLWTKLDVDELEREAFLTKHVGCKPSVITKLKNEVQRLQELRLQHIQKFIDGLRKELSDLWDKCYFGPAQREEFTPAFDDNFTEELLAHHKNQVEVLNDYYNGNKGIFRLVEKRETLFKNMEEYESRKSANCLENPCRALLKEKKISRRSTCIHKELLKIERKLMVQIGKWEEERGQCFLINGCHYTNIIEHQWAAYNAQKEQEHKRQQELMEKEMMTPVKKRPFGGRRAPLRTPKRMRIQDCTTSTQSRLPLHPSICLSPRPTGALNSKGRPPVATKSNIRRVAKAVREKMSPSNQRQSARLALKRKVLGEKTGKQW